MTDRFGICPNLDCGCDWDGGDIADTLSGMELHLYKSREEVEELATLNYGWTKENGKRFSNAISHDLGKYKLLECPDCKAVYDLDTSEQHVSIGQFFRSKMIEDDEPTGKESGRV